jgi:hypothetical protein
LSGYANALSQTRRHRLFQNNGPGKELQTCEGACMAAAHIASFYNPNKAGTGTGWICALATGQGKTSEVDEMKRADLHRWQSNAN